MPFPLSRFLKHNVRIYDVSVFNSFLRGIHLKRDFLEESYASASQRKSHPIIDTTRTRTRAPFKCPSRVGSFHSSVVLESVPTFPPSTTFRITDPPIQASPDLRVRHTADQVWSPLTPLGDLIQVITSVTIRNIQVHAVPSAAVNSSRRMR